MRILVTGSNGLVGRALTDGLRALAHDVVGLDLRAEDPADVRDASAVRDRLDGCDGVVHLAAMSRVAWAEQDPDGCIATNVGGTENVLAALQASPKRPWLLFASSREVYGNPTRSPTPEDAPLRPLNTYGRTKVEGERLTARWGAQGGRAAVVRLSNVYGTTTDHADRVVPAFARGAVAGEALRVDGRDNAFDFVHLDDAVDGLLALVDAVARRSLDPVHLVTGRATTLEDLAALACRCAGGPVHIREARPRDYDVTRFCGDPERAARVLGWRASVGIERGMAELIAAFRSISEPPGRRSPLPGPPAR